MRYGTTGIRRLLCLALSPVVLGGCSTAAAALAGGTRPPVVALVVPARDQATTAPPSDHQVFVEGDSLTVGMAEDLPALLVPAGWQVIVDAQIGRATPTGISVLSQRGAEIGGTLVVALGTNDGPDPAAFSSSIDQVMTIASGRGVIWVTVARAGWDGLDETLITAQARWSNLHVFDWRPVIAAHRAMEAGDGIHLTADGYQLRAQFIAAAVETVS